VRAHLVERGLVRAFHLLAEGAGLGAGVDVGFARGDFVARGLIPAPARVVRGGGPMARPCATTCISLTGRAAIATLRSHGRKLLTPYAVSALGTYRAFHGINTIG
jgi:hypothetical protein